MWKLGLRPHNSQKGIHKWDFRCSAENSDSSAVLKGMGDDRIMSHYQLFSTPTSPSAVSQAGQNSVRFNFLIFSSSFDCISLPSMHSASNFSALPPSPYSVPITRRTVHLTAVLSTACLALLPLPLPATFCILLDLSLYILYFPPLLLIFLPFSYSLHPCLLHISHFLPPLALTTFTPFFSFPSFPYICYNETKNCHEFMISFFYLLRNLN